MKINCFQANEVKHDGADYFESAFGMFFVFIDRVSSQAILWPLVAARGTSITCLLLLVHMRGEFHVPEKNQLGLMAQVGLFDAAGNTFFALATRMGRLDISVVLSSLYPATTVVLAWLVLKEKQREAGDVRAGHSKLGDVRAVKGKLGDVRAENSQLTS